MTGEMAHTGKNRVKAIVFDLDDTLVQSRKALNAAVGATLTAFGAPVNSSAFVALLQGTIRNLGDDLNAGRVSVQDLAEALVTAFTAELRLDRESARVLCENFFNNAMDLVEAYNDLPAALGRLRGSYTLGIATNGPGLVQREKLRVPWTGPTLTTLNGLEALLEETRPFGPSTHIDVYHLGK